MIILNLKRSGFALIGVQSLILHWQAKQLPLFFDEFGSERRHIAGLMKAYSALVVCFNCLYELPLVGLLLLALKNAKHSFRQIKI